MMLTLLLVAGYSFMACAQEPEENKAIKKVIQEVFEGMQDRNVLKVGNAFSREPVLQTIRETDGWMEDGLYHRYQKKWVGLMFFSSL